MGTACQTYRAVAEAAETKKERIAWLRKALRSIEGAVDRFRAAGIIRYLMLALHDDVLCHLQLADVAHALDPDRVLPSQRGGAAL